MKKIETIWHHLLFEAIEHQQYRHTQQELARTYNYSLSTINHAIGVPAEIGAVRKESKYFVLENVQKLLYFWASQRSISKDILYESHYPAGVIEIEGLLPSESIYAGYSAARKILEEAPADYSRVYFYLEEKKLDKAKARFPKGKAKEINVVALKAPPAMKRFGPVTTLPQTFVDIWNLKDWYGQDFIKRLEEKINEKLAG
jgi:hypothetical protein